MTEHLKEQTATKAAFAIFPATSSLAHSFSLSLSLLRVNVNTLDDVYYENESE